MSVKLKNGQVLDVNNIRLDFPIFNRKIYNKPLIYFDNAATSQKPRQVIEAISNYYQQHNANVHRGVHKLSEEATSLYEETRKKIANFINAGDSRQIIFIRNATEGINLVAYSWGRQNIKSGDEILLSQMEHHSNIVPWQILALEVGAKLKFIPLTKEGELDIKQLPKLISPKSKLLAINHVSNVLGTINPIRQIVEIARSLNPQIKVLIDGAQAVPHMSISIQTLKPDFYAFTGHKMLGPTGIGVLFVRKEILEEMPPFLTGGDMILEVSFEKSTWNYIPWKFEAGTPNVEGVIGLGAAVDYLANLDMKKVRNHEKDLTAYALSKISGMKNIAIYGTDDPEKRGGVISFNIVDRGGNVAVHPHDLASILDVEGIAIRSGHHCAQPLMSVLGIPAAARVSFYIYNTKQEIDQLVPALEKAKFIFKVT